MANIAAGSVRWRLVALPTEHGGWGFVGEPLLLGLLLAPSVGGVALGVAAIATFLLAHPLLLVVGDQQRHKWYPRTTLALRWAAGYTTVAVLGLLGAVLLARQPFWLPLLIASPLAATQIWQQAQHQNRALLTECAGAVALGATVTMLVLLAGGKPSIAWTLWGILAVRAVTAILYVRARIRQARGQTMRGTFPTMLHLAVAGLGIICAVLGMLPWLVAVAFIGLAVRCVVGFQPRQQAIPAKVIGMQEMVVALLTVLLVAAGYHTGIR
ncbi:MAG: YwiC-like family protein [Ktedonobacterales bacterium]|nr:YwiC-like family protein [Ktedonobacterales bacterium]